MSPGSVFSDLVEVEEVYIGGPQITYEMGIGKTNIGTPPRQRGRVCEVSSGPGGREAEAGRGFAGGG